MIITFSDLHAIMELLTKNENNPDYYIDMCILWRFIREINSDISQVKYPFFLLTELILDNYQCSGYVPCCVTVNTHDCKLKQLNK